MYLIVRADLPMPVGKGYVQAGHAFSECLMRASEARPELVRDYRQGSSVKVVLVAADLAALERVHAKARARGVPACLVRDEGRTVFSEPTTTCLALGPLTKTEGNALTRGLALL